MKSRILAILLIISIALNFYLFLGQPAQKNLHELNDRINNLEKANADLNIQVYRDNLSVQNYVCSSTFTGRR